MSTWLSSELTRVMAARPATEERFQAEVLRWARLLGWTAYHTHDSRRSVSGFPDLVLARPPVVLLVELKSAQGRMTMEQKEWRELLQACDRLETPGVWRPQDWPRIIQTLR